MSSSDEHYSDHQEEESAAADCASPPSHRRRQDDAASPPTDNTIMVPELEPDDNTMRILVSTDNHLGYAENDTVRGLDSFSALEEVLYLAKHYNADMVLLAGDLFHENKPSRRTLHKTMDLFRRYTLGPNPVRIQILSSQTENFRKGLVNYEDENYSVDLPVFSIHGNHDDPTREGGSSELLAALDLLDCANFVNYIGRQEQINHVQVSPILIQKGENTHVALYGLGSMRDERLNRMWRDQKVSFLRPEEHQGQQQWFNLFALHQNRDSGRGTKNCIHESMIPEWMDLVVWGHEHQCEIHPRESVVGTFRITQPGSSVATSLTEGESDQKNIGILDIRGQDYRLLPIPLTQVRSFVMGDISLAQQRRLDPEDPKVDQKVTSVLEDQVRVLIHDAREKMKESLEAAKRAGNPIATINDNDDDDDDDDDHDDRGDVHPLKYRLNRPEEVLVRLRVDHSGFSTLNNQRFGAKFIGEAANPTDILLFSRKKQEVASSRSTSKKLKNMQPIAPDDLEEMNIEDLIVGELDNADKQLELLNEKRVSNALTDYVTKQQAQAIGDTIKTLVGKQQQKLIQGAGSNNNNTSTMMEEDAPNENKKNQDNNVLQQPFDDDKTPLRATNGRKRGAAKKPSARSRTTQEDYDDNDDGLNLASAKKGVAPARGRRNQSKNYAEDHSDDEIERVVPPPKRSTNTKRTGRKTNYSMESESEEDQIEIIDDDDEEELPPKKKTRAPATTSRSRKATAKEATSRFPDSSQPRMSQSQLSFQSVKRPSRKTTTQKKKYADDDSDEDLTPNLSISVDDDWGTATTATYK